jgi:hypothetical protein
VVFFVANTEPVAPPEEADQLFEPFQHLSVELTFP